MAEQNSGSNNKRKAKLGVHKQILTYLLLKDHNFGQQLSKEEVVFLHKFRYDTDIRVILSYALVTCEQAPKNAQRAQQ